MAVAIKQLPQDIRERLEKLFEDLQNDGFLKGFSQAFHGFGVEALDFGWFCVKVQFVRFRLPSLASVGNCIL